MSNEICADLWIDGRLRLVEPGPVDRPEGRTRTFRGELRRDDGTLQEVAVRVLEIGRLSDWRVYERFRRQGEILASLSHPRIPRALGDFEIEGRVLHCQTRVAGRTLAQHLSGGCLTGAETTRLAEDLLGVLAHLHERGIVHRDINSEGVILDGDRRAHLVDFSSAGRGNHCAPASEPEVVGTPGYMAPEQARGDGMPQSDLYALGRLLVEALGGGEAEPPLPALIAKLTNEDWRKRPVSAVEALKLLTPARAAHGFWATGIAWIL